jgi:hypothetical protein
MRLFLEYERSKVPVSASSVQTPQKAENRYTNHEKTREALVKNGKART